MMSVELIGANNLQAAEYTVNVSGVTEEVLTATVKVEAQKVSSIEILDEVAVVDKAIDSTTGLFPTATKATVGYLVKDQYGTDITKTTDLKTNDTTDTTIKAVKAKGVVELSGNIVENKRLGDLVPVVLIDPATGVSTSKTVKLSAQSTVSEIEVAGIYNAKGEKVALNDKSKASDSFIVLNLKDQYGKEITEVDAAKGLLITNTNKTNLTVKEDTVTKKTIGKDSKLVIEITGILKAGNTDILLISTTNGKSAKYTVEVAETTVVDAITVSQPEIAVAGEATLIPITVTDKEGNVITDKKLLAKGIKVGGSPVSESDFEVKDGQVYYKENFTKEGTQALVFQTSTFKVATITINVKAAKIPTVVRGLKQPLVISKAQGAVTVTAEDHLVIEDQYGRVIKGSTEDVTVTLVGESDVVSLTGNAVTPLKNGTAKLNIKLTTENGKIDSAVEVEVRVTDGKEYDSYEIATIGKTQAKQPKEFTVNGMLNGGKVALKSNEYTATISGGRGSVDVSDGKFTVAEVNLNLVNSNPVDTEFTLKVTINATGKVLEQKFVVSKDAKEVQDFFFTTAGVGSTYADAKALTEVIVNGGIYKVNSAINVEGVNKDLNVATVDQYNNKVVAALSADSVTIVPEDITKVNITNNGTVNATATLATDIDEAKLTVTVKIGNATKELKVTLKRTGSQDLVDQSGNRTINTLDNGTINIDGSITGNLTVYAPNATVNNNATVNGTITVIDVSANTWNQNASHAGEIVFNAVGKKLVVKETFTVAKLTVNAAGTTVVNNGTISEAVIAEDVALVGDTPVKVTGQGSVTGDILVAPVGAIEKDKLVGVTKAGAKFLVFGLPADGAQTPSTLEEVKTHMLETYGVDFNTDAIKITDGLEEEGATLKIVGSILNTSDWNKVKANGNKAIPYKITLVQDNNKTKVLKIAMYQDGNAVIE